MTKEELVCREAKRIGACPMMKGGEKIEQLIELFFTPQGAEFCTKYNFPKMEMLREFKGEITANSGIYIDTPVRAKNVARIALIGKETIAELEYDDPTKRHEVILMHGAQAKIKASGYAVVFVNNADGIVQTQITDKAIVI